MRLFLTLVAAATLLLTGCDSCYNVACDAADVDSIDGLHFKFDRQTFKFNEIDNAYVLRFNPGNIETPVDTLKLGTLITDSSRVFYIGTDQFSNAVDYTDFEYGIYNNSGEYAFLISNIESEGHYPDDCCCCYRNKEKTFVMNGKEYDRSGSIEPLSLVK